MSLESVVGRHYGPVRLEVTRSGVGAYVTATGDDHARWRRHAPPGFASVALFAAAPVFLADPDVVPFTRSLIHSEQTFEWHRPLGVGESVTVSGEVAGVRTRGSLNMVSFGITADGSDGRWLDGTSSFVMSTEGAGSADDAGEPSHDSRAAFDDLVPVALPAEGEDLAVLARSASRADLVRYAGATGDWNPIHWDHEAARAAGLSGVIVHGLLMAAWVMQSAGRHSADPGVVRSMRLRFRRPLRPGVAAAVSGSVTAAADAGSDLALTVSSAGATLVTASTRVTR